MFSNYCIYNPCVMMCLCEIKLFYKNVSTYVSMFTRVVILFCLHVAACGAGVYDTVLFFCNSAASFQQAQFYLVWL